MILPRRKAHKVKTNANKIIYSSKEVWHKTTDKESLSSISKHEELTDRSSM